MRTVKIYVGNLSEHSKATDLRNMFQSYGRVVECDVLQNYGFVHMEDDRDARDAIHALHGCKLYGQPLTVELSLSQRGGGSRRGRPSERRNRYPPYPRRSVPYPPRPYPTSRSDGPYRSHPRDDYVPRRNYHDSYDRMTPPPPLPPLPPPRMLPPVVRDGYMDMRDDPYRMRGKALDSREAVRQAAREAAREAARQRFAAQHQRSPEPTSRRPASSSYDQRRTSGGDSYDESPPRRSSPSPPPQKSRSSKREDVEETRHERRGGSSSGDQSPPPQSKSTKKKKRSDKPHKSKKSSRQSHD